MANKPIHRFPSSSKMGRQIAANVPVREQGELTKEQKEWNAEVDARKKQKAFAKRIVDPNAWAFEHGLESFNHEN